MLLYPRAALAPWIEVFFLFFFFWSVHSCRDVADVRRASCVGASACGHALRGFAYTLPAAYHNPPPMSPTNTLPHPPLAVSFAKEDNHAGDKARFLGEHERRVWKQQKPGLYHLTLSKGGWWSRGVGGGGRGGVVVAVSQGRDNPNSHGSPPLLWL